MLLRVINNWVKIILERLLMIIMQHSNDLAINIPPGNEYFIYCIICLGEAEYFCRRFINNNIYRLCRVFGKRFILIEISTRSKG